MDLRFNQVKSIVGDTAVSPHQGGRPARPASPAADPPSATWRPRRGACSYRRRRPRSACPSPS
jgi:hypothetical protein